MAKEKILVFTKNWLGDVVFEAAALKTIKENYPESELVCVAPKRCQAILENYPYVDRVLLFDEKKNEKPFKEKLARAREWKQERFTKAFLFHRSFTRALLVRLAGIPFRAGYNTKGRGFLLTHSIPSPAPGFHDTDYFLNLLKGAGLNSELGRPYEFYFSNGDEIRVLRMLHKMNIMKNNFIVFHTGANWDTKRWSMDSFYHLIQLIQKRAPMPILLTGTNDDAERIWNLTRKALDLDVPVVSLAGETQIGELGALFSFSRAVVSNDSGPLHIASGVGAKTVAIFGPTDAVKTGPRGMGEWILLNKDKIEDITPEEVMEALVQLRVFNKQVVVVPTK
jgi:heptosyltransferase-2